MVQTMTGQGAWARMTLSGILFIVTWTLLGSAAWILGVDYGLKVPKQQVKEDVPDKFPVLVVSGGGTTTDIVLHRALPRFLEENPNRDYSFLVPKGRERALQSEQSKRYKYIDLEPDTYSKLGIAPGTFRMKRLKNGEQMLQVQADFHDSVWIACYTATSGGIKPIYYQHYPVGVRILPFGVPLAVNTLLWGIGRRICRRRKSS